KVIRKGGAVHINPWPCAAQREVMDSACYYFLAATRLTRNENSRVAPGDGLGSPHQVLHRCAANNRGHSVKGTDLRLFRQPAARRDVLPMHAVISSARYQGSKYSSTMRLAPATYKKQGY